MKRVKTMINIDSGLKRQMKAQCAIDDVSLYEAVEEALDDWLIKRSKEKRDET